MIMQIFTRETFNKKIEVFLTFIKSHMHSDKDRGVRVSMKQT